MTTDPIAAQAFEPINDDIRQLAHYDVGYAYDAEREREHQKRLMVTRAAMEPTHRPGPPQFSLARFLRSIVDNTPVNPVDRIFMERSAETIKQPFDRNRAWVDWSHLGRAMTSQPGSAGGYLVGTDQLEPVDILRGVSVAAAAGIQTPSGFSGNVTIPVLKTDAPATAVAEGGTPTAGDPVFGQHTASPRTISTIVPVSMQLLKQSDERAERFLRLLVMRSVGSTFDRFILSGAGGVQPLGLMNVTGVNTQAGASLDHEDLLEMRRLAVAAGADEEALVWLGAPDVQKTLGNRQRFTGASRTCWDDDGILGKKAVATKNVPTGALVVGQFAHLIAPVFGPGIRIDIDPSTLFNSGGIRIRALLFADLVAHHPAAFTVAKEIT